MRLLKLVSALVTLRIVCGRGGGGVGVGGGGEGGNTWKGGGGVKLCLTEMVQLSAIHNCLMM